MLPGASGIPVFCVAILCGLGVAPAVMGAEQSELSTVAAVDLTRYEGRWYEVAKYPNRFQKHCARDTTADYTRRADGHIQVVNCCVQADGSVEAVQGLAKISDPATGAKLKVSFLPAWLRWSGLGWGNYWVIGLAEDYRYAVVGEPSRQYLWILARKPKLEAADREAINALVKSAGYDPARLADSPQSPQLPQSPQSGH